MSPLAPEGTIITAHASCRRILRLPASFAAALVPGRPAAQTLDSLSSIDPFLEPFVSAIRHQITRGKAEWQQEIRLERAEAPLVLLMRGSVLRNVALPGEVVGHGQVVVFDDVTILNQAQRDAAWSEVARRLAHEVKNPLTPIRLAAERLRMKLSDKLGAEDRELLDRASRTIVTQVEALRTLVDAFGDDAREPCLSRNAGSLTHWANIVGPLYHQGRSQTR